MKIVSTSCYGSRPGSSISRLVWIRSSRGGQSVPDTITYLPRERFDAGVNLGYHVHILRSCFMMDPLVG